MRRGVGWSSDWSKISAVGRGGARFPPRWVELGSSGVRGAAGFDLSHGLLLPAWPWPRPSCSPCWAAEPQEAGLGGLDPWPRECWSEHHRTSAVLPALPV